MSSTFLYFAYGSNLLPRRLQERTPSARLLDRVSLAGYALRWHQRSHDGSGKCDVVQVDDAASCVWGVVYEIQRAEKHALDAAEALGEEYDEHLVPVSGNGTTHQATIYRGLKPDPALRPYTWYHALVLAGAHEHAFPEDYILAMQAVPTQPDPDSQRAERFARLARGE